MSSSDALRTDDARHPGSAFIRTDLSQSRFEDVNLSSATFHDVNLRQATFEDVALTGACLRNACLGGVRLEGCNLDGMTIDGIPVSDLLKAYAERSSRPPSPAPVPAWIDLTVDDATRLRDFYRDAVGWSDERVAMEGYDDFAMQEPGAPAPCAGICHRRGPNASIPPVWLPYFRVASLDASLRAVALGGGTVVDGPREMGTLRFAVVRDPAGAHCALIQ